MILTTSRYRVMVYAVFAVFYLGLLPPSVGAASVNVNVVCPGGGPGAYSSISAALNSLNPNNSNTITVSGTCVENILISNFERLLIQAAGGQTATITAADPNGIVLQTFQSAGITLSGLTIQGGATGVLLNQGSNVTIANCTSQLTMRGGPHQVQGSGSSAADPTLRAGIRLNRGSLNLAGGTQISNNVGPGIRADQNTRTSLSNVTITSNSEEGIHLDRQSVGGFFPPLAISGNGIASISCDSTSLVFGDVSTVSGISCQRIERAMGPSRPGRVLP